MPLDLEGRRSLISIRLQMLITVFGKRTTDESLEGLKRVFCEALENFPERVILKGFGKAEQELDRFPTPRAMREICGEAMPPNTWRYHYEPGTDPEGNPCLIDPDPDCDHCNEPRSWHPSAKCPMFSGERRKYMYRPQDCEEGREFLKQLAILGSRLDVRKGIPSAPAHSPGCLCPSCRKRRSAQP